jgi:hypothetical protein
MSVSRDEDDNTPLWRIIRALFEFSVALNQAHSSGGWSPTSESSEISLRNLLAVSFFFTGLDGGNGFGRTAAEAVLALRPPCIDIAKVDHQL